MHIECWLWPTITVAAIHQPGLPYNKSVMGIQRLVRRIVILGNVKSTNKMGSCKGLGPKVTIDVSTGVDMNKVSVLQDISKFHMKSTIVAMDSEPRSISFDETTQNT